jgi:hypothetical protein
MKSFRALSPNASKLADLVENKATVTFGVSGLANPTATSFSLLGGGQTNLEGGGASYTPSMGYEYSAWVAPGTAPNDPAADAE